MPDNKKTDYKLHDDLDNDRYLEMRKILISFKFLYIYVITDFMENTNLKLKLKMVYRIQTINHKMLINNMYIYNARKND